jgi:class 3 adenylate cyclase
MSESVNIVIAEDEKIIALDLSNTLQKLGYKIAGIAASGTGIFPLIEKFNPSLVMMDIMLEGDMTGIEAAEIIARKYGLPVVFLTALTDDETIDKAKMTNPFGYVLKPYDEKTLHSSIEMALYKHKIERELQLKSRQLEEEKKKTDELLKNILPEEIVEEIKVKGAVKPRYYPAVSVLFTEFSDFDLITSVVEPGELLNEVNEVFENFDKIIQKYGIEKLKTIGDSYMIASGLPVAADDHAIKILQAAVEMQEYIKKRNQFRRLKLEMKVGIHSGAVVAGIVGMKKFTYDIWGDAVNIASRMASGCEPNKINISGDTFNLVKSRFKCIHRGKMNAKGKGEIDMYFVEC